jgi:hypothetical protein
MNALTSSLLVQGLASSSPTRHVYVLSARRHRHLHPAIPIIARPLSPVPEDVIGGGRSQGSRTRRSPSTAGLNPHLQTPGGSAGCLACPLAD